MLTILLTGLSRVFHLKILSCLAKKAEQQD